MNGKWRAIAAISLAFPVSVFAFDMDLELDDFRREIPIFVLEDLTLGETGIIIYPPLCAEDGQLAIPRYARLSETSSRLTEFRFLRTGPDTLALTVQPSRAGQTNSAWDDDQDTFEILQMELYMAYTQHCWDEATFSIDTINGRSTLSELMETGL